MLQDQNSLNNTPVWALKMLAWLAVVHEKMVLLNNLATGETVMEEDEYEEWRRTELGSL
jgi:hypothetical protein